MVASLYAEEEIGHVYFIYIALSKLAKISPRVTEQCYIREKVSVYGREQSILRTTGALLEKLFLHICLITFKVSKTPGWQ